MPTHEGSLEGHWATELGPYRRCLLFMGLGVPSQDRLSVSHDLRTQQLPSRENWEGKVLPEGGRQAGLEADIGEKRPG